MVVDCNYKMPTQSLFEQVIYPLNLCQPLTTVPKAWGSCSIVGMLTALGPDAPVYDAQIVNNGPPNSLANPPGHAYDNLILRITQAATLFSPYVTGQAQAPLGINCLVSEDEPFNGITGITISPNPFYGSFRITVPTSKSGQAMISVSDMYGKDIYYKETAFQQGENSLKLDIQTIPGIYFIRVEMLGKVVTGKVVAY